MRQEIPVSFARHSGNQLNLLWCSRLFSVISGPFLPSKIRLALPVDSALGRCGTVMILAPVIKLYSYLIPTTSTAIFVALLLSKDYLTLPDLDEASGSTCKMGSPFVFSLWLQIFFPLLCFIWMLFILSLTELLIIWGNFPSSPSACKPDNSFSPFSDDYKWWSQRSFFEITLRGGSLTFSQAKAVDVTWDLVCITSPSSYAEDMRDSFCTER